MNILGVSKHAVGGLEIWVNKIHDSDTFFYFCNNDVNYRKGLEYAWIIHSMIYRTVLFQTHTELLYVTADKAK